ncbi:MAG TPA: FAD-dependent oxidoreductase [Thermoanaerobaculia bacterium]|nr:FAD-dependent oxidoreductase [Thermoanaerobaculia bacterium]
MVLGSGFAGYSLLLGLPARGWQRTLITPRNYFLFTPLLPSAVTGVVEFRSIVEPARRRLAGVSVLEAEATGIDWPARLVECRSSLSDETFAVPFDDLVVAVGTGTADFGVPGVGAHSLPLNTIGDARRIRQRILEQFALASLPSLAPAEVRRRLTFVVCGAGPTGVEVAAEIHDLLRRELLRSFGALADQARLVLIEAGPRILRSFDEALAVYAQRHFQREHIEVRLETTVRRLEADRVVLGDGSEIPSGLVVWAAGTAALPLVRAAFADVLNDQGRIRVDSFLRVVGRERVWAAGDCAVTEPGFPATAQVAQQQGSYLARALSRQARGLEVRAFRFRYQGMLAYIGGGEALADLPGLKGSGRGAWLFWRSVYLTKLVSLSNKVKVLFDWAKSMLFGRDLARF